MASAHVLGLDKMLQAVIFDVDGTLIDSVDLHARAWHETFIKFGYSVSFEQARSQIGKGGDQLLPTFLTQAEIDDQGEDIETWRGKLFKSEFLPMVRPFSAVPELLRRVRLAEISIAVASSAKKDELERYLDIAGIKDMVDVTTSADDAKHSKPAPDIFQSVLAKLGISGREAVAVGDTPYDAEAAMKAAIEPVGVLCGGFNQLDLLKSGCVAVYPGPAALLACFDASPLARKRDPLSGA
jgi:beta-phosphoglucomutase-like phosphatase (HAD superfamily)